MADNWTQFSESLTVDTDEQKAWLEKWLEPYNENMNPAELQKWCEERGLDPNGDDADWWPNFNFSFTGAETSTGPKAPWHMWIREDESGTPDHVAAMVMAYFRKFKIDSTFTLTWAEVCSKQHIGEFSGGGFIVLPFGRKVEWSNPYMLFDKIHAQLKTKAAKKGKKKHG
jgi:hypothetical protein